MNLEEKIKFAKSKGIKQASNMKEETLDKRIAALSEDEPEVKESKEASPVPTKIDKTNRDRLDKRHFNWDRFYIHAKQLRADRLEYEEAHKNFKVIRDGKHVDNIIALSF